jgi:fluoride exporter
MARHWMSTMIVARTATVFPWGTFFVNVLGSALIGFVIASSEARISPATRQFLAVGFLGGFTTFSAFSVQTLHLFQNGKAGVALVYAVASVVVCVSGCWLGSLVAEKV